MVWVTPAVLRAAGTPAEVLPDLGALLLCGGDDIDPARYGEPFIEGVDVKIEPDRYGVEMPLVRAAIEHDVPMLGICGGMQEMNVASGGSLHQDLSLAGVDPMAHKVKGTLVYHSIVLTAGSRLASLLGGTTSEVNSSHHQSVKRPGKGAVITALAPDGVVEAIEFPECRFAIGVQWHPERMPDDVRQRRLFDALVSSALQQR